MPTFSERKEIALEQKLAALSAEFDQWLRITGAGQGFEKHHTQVRAITGHLQGLRKRTGALLADAAAEKTILGEGRNIESLTLGIRRIWEFFRAKLVQRRDPDQRAFLQLADELAWGCYKPALDRFPGARREPPLVFLNGGLSPFALSRDQAFPAEAVPGEPLAGRTYDDILQSLPIPMIGVPWHQTAHLPDLPVVAHETGHAVEHDFALHDTIVKRINGELAKKGRASRASAWIAWSSEMFADAWGCLTLGPAYASALRDFLIESETTIRGEIATADGKYPTATLRMLLCACLLETTFGAEAAAGRAAWLEQYPIPEPDRDHGMKEYVGDIPSIAAALSLPDLWSTEAALTLDDWNAAAVACGEVRAGSIPESASTAARLVAAARRLYDENPRDFAQKKWSELILAQAAALIRPGTRAGETLLDDEAKQALSDEAQQQGVNAFEPFRKWAGR